MRCSKTSVGALGFVLFFTCGAFAQTRTNLPDRSIEAFGGFALSAVRIDGSVPSSFAAPFLFTSSPSTSLAEQVLKIAGDHGTGVELGVNFFPSRHVGLQVRFDRSHGEIAGANTPYVVHLDYVSTPPPSYRPVVIRFDQTYPWPDTSGRWRSSALSFGPVVRASLGGRVTGTVSGGLTYFRVGATVAPLALSSYWLGGHSVLFSSLYRLEAEARPSNKIGLNVGGGASIALSRAVAVLADLRWLYSGRVELPLTTTLVLNPSQIIVSPLDLEFVRSAMVPGPGPLPIDPARLRVTIGAQVTLFRARQ